MVKLRMLWFIKATTVAHVPKNMPKDKVNAAKFNAAIKSSNLYTYQQRKKVVGKRAFIKPVRTWLSA